MSAATEAEIHAAELLGISAMATPEAEVDGAQVLGLSPAELAQLAEALAGLLASALRGGVDETITKGGSDPDVPQYATRRHLGASRRVSTRSHGRAAT